MELREAGCRKCQRSSAGDCGDHGPKLVTTTQKEAPAEVLAGVQRGESPAEPFGAGAPERPALLTKQQLTEKHGDPLPPPAIPLYHFVCSLDPNHVIYVKAGHSMPPAPVICPWKCGWMNLVGEVSATCGL